MGDDLIVTSAETVLQHVLDQVDAATPTVEFVAIDIGQAGGGDTVLLRSIFSIPRHAGS